MRKLAYLVVLFFVMGVLGVGCASTKSAVADTEAKTESADDTAPKKKSLKKFSGNRMERAGDDEEDD